MTRSLLILSLVLICAITAIGLYFYIDFFKKIWKEKKLITKVDSIYRNTSFFVAVIVLTYVIFPILLIASAVVCIVSYVNDDTTLKYVGSSLYALYAIAVLSYIIMFMVSPDSYFMFVYHDNLILVSRVVKLDKIAVIDVKTNPKIIYMYYINDEMQKVTLHFKGRRKLKTWLCAQVTQKQILM